MEDEALDSRGRNVTLFVFGGIVLLIAGLVFNNYRVKQDRIAGMLSADPKRQAAKVREMMAGFTNDGHVAEQLQGERPSVRSAAVRALRALATDAATDEKTRKDAARLTVPFLKDSDQPIKDQAIQSLTAMGPEIAIDAVTNALGDSDNSVKGGAQAVCQNFAPYSIAPLLGFVSAEGKTDGAKARLRTPHRNFAGNALFEISKKDDRWKTVILFGDRAVGERQATVGDSHARLQEFMGMDKPLLVPATVPVYGVVDYLDPAASNEDDQNNAISILDRMADQRATPYIMEKLAAPATRRAAVGALGRLADPRATQELLKYLPTDETNRLDIVIALGRIADPKATDALIEHGLGSVSDTVRAAAADSLRNIGEPALQKLIAAANSGGASDPSYYRAEGAVLALGGLRLPAATQAAAAKLKHPAQNVREAAAQSLGDSGNPMVIPALINSFEDTDGRVAGFAARSLSRFGTKAVPPLVQALGDEERVYWASLALRYVGGPAAPELRKSVEAVGALSSGGLSRHAATLRRARAAATLLGDIGDVESVEILKQALAHSQDPDFEFAASSSLQRLGTGMAEPPES